MPVTRLLSSLQWGYIPVAHRKPALALVFVRKVCSAFVPRGCLCCLNYLQLLILCGRFCWFGPIARATGTRRFSMTLFSFSATGDAIDCVPLPYSSRVLSISIIPIVFMFSGLRWGSPSTSTLNSLGFESALARPYSISGRLHDTLFTHPSVCTNWLNFMIFQYCWFAGGAVLDANRSQFLVIESCSVVQLCCTACCMSSACISPHVAAHSYSHDCKYVCRVAVNVVRSSESD